MLLVLFVITTSARRPTEDHCTSLGIPEDVRLGCERVANSKDDLTRLAIERGGYPCRFALLLLLQQQHHHHKERSALSPASFHQSIEAACSSPRRELPPSTIRVVVSVQHNGLGNQIFQMAVADALARSLDATSHARQMRDFEGPMSETLPPNTESSWKALNRLFGDRGKADEESICTDRMSPLKSEYEKNGTLIIAQRPADTRRQPLAVSIRRLLLGGSDLKCLKLIGFFQDYGLLALGRKLELFEKFFALRDLDATRSYEGLQNASDIVCHVRVCKAGVGGHYHYYDYDTYFEPILRHLGGGNQTDRRITVVTRCPVGKGGVVDDLIKRAGATLARKSPPPKRPPRGRNFVEDEESDPVAADFLYLARARGALIVTESSFSWWAAYLGRAGVVHAPSSGSLPVPYDEPRYVFHDPRRGQYFGTFENETREFRFKISSQRKRR